MRIDKICQKLDSLRNEKLQHTIYENIYGVLIMKVISFYK